MPNGWYVATDPEPTVSQMIDACKQTFANELRAIAWGGYTYG